MAKVQGAYDQNTCCQASAFAARASPGTDEAVTVLQLTVSMPPTNCRAAVHRWSVPQTCCTSDVTRCSNPARPCTFDRHRSSIDADMLQRSGGTTRAAPGLSAAASGIRCRTRRNNCSTTCTRCSASHPCCSTTGTYFRSAPPCFSTTPHHCSATRYTLHHHADLLQ